MSGPETPPVTPPRAAASSRWPRVRLSLAAQLGLLILIVTVVGALALHIYIQRQQRIATAVQLGIYTEVLQDHLTEYENLLLASSSHLYASAREQHATNLDIFSEGLELQRNFPSVLDLGMRLFLIAPTGPMLEGLALERLGNLQLNGQQQIQLVRVAEQAIARGQVQISQPLETAEGQRLVAFRPCPASAAQGCVVYAVIDSTRLLAELDASTPLSQSSVALLVGGQPLRSAALETGALDSVSQGEAAARSLLLLGTPSQPFSLSLKALGQNWTVRLPAYAVPPSPSPTHLLPAMLLLLGTLTALLTYRLVRDQTHLNSQLQDTNTALMASQTYLGQSRADFAAIFQSMENGAVFTTPSGQIRMMNRRFVSLMGLGSSDIHRKSAGDMAQYQSNGQAHGSQTENEPARDSQSKTLTELLGGGAGSPEVYSGVVRQLRGARGRLFDAELSRTRVLGADGELLGYLHVVRNVTRRMLTERRLREQELHSRQALDGVPHMLWLSDAQGKLTYGNTCYYGSLPGGRVAPNIAPESQAAYQAMWARAYATGKAQELDVQIRVRGAETTSGSATPHKRTTSGNDISESSTFTPDTSDGGTTDGQSRTAPLQASARWFSLMVAPMHDENGEVVEWIAVATDVHARLETERRLRAEQRYYKQVLDGLPQVVWTSDAGFNIVLINKRWAEHHPSNPTPASLAELATHIHPRDQQRFLAVAEQARHSQDPAELSVRVHRPRLQQPAARGSSKTEYRHAVLRIVPLYDESGQVTEWVGTSSDVNGQVEAEQAARLLMQVSDALSQPLMENLHEEAQARAALQRFQNALEIMARYLNASATLWLVRPSYAPASHTPTLIESPTSLAVRTRRESAPLAMVAWLEDAQTSAANAVDSQLSHDSEAIMRRLAAEVSAQFPQQVQLTQEIPPTPRVGIGYALVGHDGDLRGVLTLELPEPLSPLEVQLSGQFVRRISTALDNDVLRQRVADIQRDLVRLNQSLEERVRLRTKALGAANKELEAFSYSVSHDLRAPLRHMTSFSELLDKRLQAEAEASGEPLSPKVARYLSVIRESGGRMSQLIDDLLEFSRTGRADLRCANVSLERLAREEWQRLAPDREAGAAITFEVGTLPDAWGDERLLRQVFANLLGNAIKYSRGQSAPRVHVSAERFNEATTLGTRQIQGARQMVKVMVHDNGVGFDMAYRDKLFGVFQRLHSSQEFEGTGIGLANVRRIIERHGGEVFAHSVQGEGASFGFSLPLAPDVPPSGNPRPRALPSPTSAQDTAATRGEDPPPTASSPSPAKPNAKASMERKQGNT